jgi:K+-transporting ATPase ATPase C chain
MKDFVASVRMLLWFTLLCGGIYTLAVTGVAQVLFKDKADGSLVRTKDGALVGSTLLAQEFKTDKYFAERPSAVKYDPQASGGSNLGPTSAALKKQAEDNRAALAKANPGQGEAPQDLVFASASGLDPHISPDAARYQIARVAAARKFDAAHTAALKDLVERSIEGPDLGVFGQDRVNVLKLNLALDALPQ